MPKPLPIFTQMPWHVKESILESADNATLITLRSCSKELRMRLSDSKMIYDSLELSVILDLKMIKVSRELGGNVESVEFYSRERGYLKKVGDTETRVISGDFISGAVHQFMKTLRHPKSVIRRMRIDFGRSHFMLFLVSSKRAIMSKLTEALRTLPYQLSVIDFCMINNCDDKEIVKVLTFLKPTTLYRISLWPKEINYTGYFCHIDLRLLAQTEQWKQAKVLFLGRYMLALPNHKTFHFSDIYYNIRTLMLEETMELIECISTGNASVRRVNCGEVANNVMQFLSGFTKTTRENGDLYAIRRPGKRTCYVLFGNEVQNMRQIGFYREFVF